MNARDIRMFRRGGPEALAAEAERQAEAKRRAKARQREKRSRAPTHEKPARDGTIRDRVFARAGGLCEFCRKRPSKEWHHVIGGGVRRLLESVETTAAICWECHKAWGRGDLEVLASALAWAIRRGFRTARKAIGRRTRKVLEAKRDTRRSA